MNAESRRIGPSVESGGCHWRRHLAEPREGGKFYFLSQLVVPRDASGKPSIKRCLCFYVVL